MQRAIASIERSLDHQIRFEPARKLRHFETHHPGIQHRDERPHGKLRAFTNAGDERVRDPVAQIGLLAHRLGQRRRQDHQVTCRTRVRNHGHLLFFEIHHARREGIAAGRHGQDVVVLAAAFSQCLAQGRNVDREVGLAPDTLGPELQDELFLAHQLRPLLDQDLQEGQCLVGRMHPLAVPVEPTMATIEDERAELVHGRAPTPKAPEREFLENFGFLWTVYRDKQAGALEIVPDPVLNFILRGRLAPLVPTDRAHGRAGLSSGAGQFRPAVLCT